MFCSLWTKCKCRNHKYGGAIGLLNYLKDKNIGIPISFIGSHVQALPKNIKKRKKY